ncbi:MAG: hypothetical protein Q4F95_01905 [Oscillospiraceae bacterium]|nr:hypothetical protein [Oscillospiraceae bacterium]
MNDLFIPKNDLTDEIQELVEICQSFEDYYETEFYPPAEDEEIDKWQQLHEIKLPQSFKDWLRFSNGSVICDTAARFYDLGTIAALSDCPDDCIVIGEFSQDGDRLSLCLSTGIYTLNENGKIREFDSFKKVLRKLIDIM